MVEFLQYGPDSPSESSDSVADMELMQMVSDQAMEVAPERSIVLRCSIQGKAALFLIDSGSSNSFLSAALATNLPGKLPLSRPCKVKVAGGGILPCTHYVPDCSWSYRNLTFSSSFKILPLAHYDGIVGMDWLSTHSPQMVDWKKKWFAFQHKDSWVCLQGQNSTESECTVVEVQLLSEVPAGVHSIPPEIQSLLDSFAEVFSEPKGLPPVRNVTHSIPLVTGSGGARGLPWYSCEYQRFLQTKAK
jgi:hypothetical protein